MTSPAATLPTKLNGTQNKMRSEDRSVHDWYRFVLSFPPHLVREYLERFRATTKSLVLDPFCGTGTTLVECKKLGIASVGLEANPVAHFASEVKTDWSLSSHGLLRDARTKANWTLEKLLEDGVPDAVPIVANGRCRTPLQNLSPEQVALLLKNSISPVPLHKTLRLLEILRNHPNRYSRHESLGLAKALVESIGNLHFGPEVGVGPPKEDVSVVRAWCEKVEIMAADLQDVVSFKKVPSVVYLADARATSKFLSPRSIDIVITSPPYPNEKDYTRTTRLESVLLGFVKDKKQLRDLKQLLVRSNTRNVYVHDDDDKHVESFPEIQEIARAIEARRLELGKNSGFERLYHRVAKLYFGGIARHLSELRVALKPNAKLAYVVGDQASYLRVMIRTGAIIGKIAESLGYQVVSIDLFRTRLATATKAQLNEEVVVLRWPSHPKQSP